ncbi:MAG: chemoreceptor glutamine deamidase CheD [Algicola sp.]|nr:chemoreceptor glutamine deamidase CheD [Algicola sp.]
MYEHLSPPIAGFETVKRFWDKTRNITITKLLPGEFYVSTSQEMISTVLGSCVSACLWDESNKIGGMNHFLLPTITGENGSSNSYALRYGNWIMESLINELLKHGAKRQHIRAKVFGGASIKDGLPNSDRNVKFILAHLMLENIPLVGENTGGNLPRKVMFNPLTGRTQIKALQKTRNDTIQVREQQYNKDLRYYEFDSNIELFKS